MRKNDENIIKISPCRKMMKMPQSTRNSENMQYIKK